MHRERKSIRRWLTTDPSNGANSVTSDQGRIGKGGGLEVWWSWEHCTGSTELRQRDALPPHITFPTPALPPHLHIEVCLRINEYLQALVMAADCSQRGRRVPSFALGAAYTRSMAWAVDTHAKPKMHAQHAYTPMHRERKSIRRWLTTDPSNGANSVASDQDRR